MGVAAIHTAACRLGSGQGLFNGSREFSSWTPVLHLSTVLAISSKVVFPLCLMPFCLFLSPGRSLRALMMGRRQRTQPLSGPICSEGPVSLWFSDPSSHQLALVMSSPNFLGDRPRGPILGARAVVAPTFSPVHLRCTTFISLGSNFGGMVEAADVRWTWIRGDRKKLYLSCLWDKRWKAYFRISIQNF